MDGGYSRSGFPSPGHDASDLVNFQLRECPGGAVSPPGGGMDVRPGRPSRGLSDWSRNHAGGRNYSVQLCHKLQSDERHCTLVLCPFLTVVCTAMRPAPAIRPARNPAWNPPWNPRPRIAALRKRPPLNRASWKPPLLKPPRPWKTPPPKPPCMPPKPPPPCMPPPPPPRAETTSGASIANAAVANNAIVTLRNMTNPSSKKMAPREV